MAMPEAAKKVREASSDTGILANSTSFIFHLHRNHHHRRSCRHSPRRNITGNGTSTIMIIL